MRKAPCGCAGDYRVIHTADYARIKRLLDSGRHPAFIGRKMVAQYARNGGAMIFTYDGQDVAIAMVNPAKNTLNVLNVAASHRSHGLGSAVIEYLQCNFARVLESAVPFFERNGYLRIGEMKQGDRYKTQIMVKGSLRGLAGRIARIFDSSRT